MPRFLLRPATRAGLILCALYPVLSGCDVPTELPRWDTRWVIPAESTSFAVAELLPDGISVATGGEAFEVNLAAIGFSRSLREICEVCVPLDGTTLPKPPFTVSFGAEVSLPDELLSARLAGGAIEVRIQHDFSFDPLRPGGTERGYLILTVTSGATVLARDSLSGSAVSLPPGATLSRTLPLHPEAISGAIQVGITLYSPAGDPVAIDLADRLSVDVPAARILVEDARILVSARPISTPPIQLELEDIDAAVTERARGGALHLQIENPFEISGSFELRIASAAALIVKTVEIAPGRSDARIELASEELRSILGQSDVRLTVSGLASSSAEGTAVEPTDVIGLRAQLELVISSTRE